MFNTINPSLGPNMLSIADTPDVAGTPTDFDPGTLTNEEFQIQVELRRHSNSFVHLKTSLAFFKERTKERKRQEEDEKKKEQEKAKKKRSVFYTVC